MYRFILINNNTSAKGGLTAQMHSDRKMPLFKTEDQETLRLNKLMRNIKRMMSNKQEQSILKRYLRYKKKPKTKPQGWS